MLKDLIIYHAACADGFAAAWAAHRYFGGVAEYVPAKYGDPPPDVAGRDVYVLDFSYKRPVLIEMAKSCNRLTVIDHHRSAEQELEPIRKELESVRSVALSNGKFAYIDVEDADIVGQYSWSEAKHGGAVAYMGGGRENPKSAFMHRLIMDAPDGTLVDHKNRNPLDNRRLNLRFATRQQNAANMVRRESFKGVTKSRSHWLAQIMVSGERRYLGVFDSPEEAAKVYDAAAREAFGEFARCNFGDADELFPPNIELVFDMGKSGGRLAWEFFSHDEKSPWLIDWTEDRDLWLWRLPESREASAFLASHPFDFALWDCLASITPGDSRWERLVAEGAAIIRYQDQKVEEQVRLAGEVEIDGHKVLAVNATHLISEIAGKLAEGRPFGACFFIRADGRKVWSLRSRDGGIDVSEIARKRGGGGHRNAAGFTE